MRIAHISDIHVGKSWMFRQEMLRKAIKQINNGKADLVVLTGDVSDWGLRSEFEAAASILDGIKKPLYIIPGNHDARINGYEIFTKIFGGGRGRYFKEKFDDLLLLGLDTAEPDIDDGHVGRDQLEWLEKQIKKNKKDRIPVIMLHHHLVSVPDTGRERNILVDAGEVLQVIDQNNVPLVLTGHKHVPWVWHLNETLIATTGTTSCARTSYPNSYNMVDIRKKEITISRHDIEKDRDRILKSVTVAKGKISGKKS
jgi:3',5'-cyclic AMP phosphodiesterase CpdA